MEHNLVIYSSTYRDDYIFDGITISYDHTRYGLLHIYLWHICSIASALLAAATSQQDVVRDRAIFCLFTFDFFCLYRFQFAIYSQWSVNHSQVTTTQRRLLFGFIHM